MANAQNLHLTRHTFVWFRYRLLTKYTSSVPPRIRRAVSASSPRPVRSSDSSSVTPSSKPSLSPASTLSLRGARVSRRATVAIVVESLVAVPVGCRRMDVHPSVTERIARFADRMIAAHATPGVAVALTDRDRLLAVVLRGHADPAAGRP